MPEILEIIIAVLIIVTAALWALFKVYLPNLVNVAITRIEHSQNQEIKQLESRLELHSTALSNSMHIASRIEDAYRIKAIDATSNLWKESLRIKNTFAPLIAIESILTENEFLSAISKPNEANEKISSVIKEYSSLQNIMEKMIENDDKFPNGMEIAWSIGTASNRFDETRIFVSEKLLRIYYCILDVHGRFGALVNQGIESGTGKAWKTDPVMEEIVLHILSRKVWEQVTKMELAGFKTLIQLLEREFSLEAKKSMRGFENLADSVSKVSQIIQEEEAKARLRRDYL